MSRRTIVLMRFEFQTDDVIYAMNPDDADDDKLSRQVVLGTEELDDEVEAGDGLTLRNVPVTQVLAVKYDQPNGRVGVGMVTDVGVDFLLPLVSPVDWSMLMVVRGGEKIHVGDLVPEVLGKPENSDVQ